MAMDLLWTLLGTSDTIFECLASSLYKVLVQDGLQEAFGIDFGQLLEGLREELGDLGWVFRNFGKDFGRW